MARSAFLASVVVVAFLGAGSALAAVGDCVASNGDYADKNRLKKYRINSNSFLDLGLTTGQAWTAVVTGADVWNDQGSSGFFRVLGDSTLPDIPLTKALCDAAGVDYSLVRAVDECAAKASTEERCCDGSTCEGDTYPATQFIIKVRTRDAACNLWDWSVEGIGPGEWDLVQTMAHEFGHTQGLGHPANGEFATLKPTDEGTARSRDLYQWDLKCLGEISGYRALLPLYRFMQAGAIGDEHLLPLATGAPKKISAQVSRTTPVPGSGMRRFPASRPTVRLESCGSDPSTSQVSTG